MAVLHLAPDAPAVLRTAADFALIFHIGGGSLGMISGAAALVFKKGSAAHRAAGNIFFVSMLTMSGIGAVVAPMLNDRVSSTAGVLTFYLVATAWAAALRKDGNIGVFERIAIVVPLSVLVVGAIFIYMAAHDPSGTVDRQPVQALYIFLLIGAIAALGDVHNILRRGLSGAQRIARHLWRMCFSLFIATGSFFLGQQQVLPKEWHGSPLLFLPVLAPLALMVFWLARTYLTAAFRAPQGSVAYASSEDRR
ncbi:MAG: hypothetical protein GC190_16565 [Alphaproteobacteria bacterium]|nr:hypothetical protein [Alphaproteobacteria bacterium]